MTPSGKSQGGTGRPPVVRRPGQAPPASPGGRPGPPGREGDAVAGKPAPGGARPAPRGGVPRGAGDAKRRRPDKPPGRREPGPPRVRPSGPRSAPAFVRPGFPELLAPAGSVESYFAAVSAGADAVYLGLQKFNARERAENFTLDELCRILPHARSRGVRIYVAMNTLLTEADLPEAISLLHQVAPLSPDAVIVQDLGLMRIVREIFPAIKLHVSTQAGCASADAAEAFARLGAERVILERHLEPGEVRRIVAAARVGVEIFVHGAMCYSWSGKCFFSSYLGGKSGNRGACVQPCRRLYGHPGGEEALFSTRDLSLMDRLPELVPLGFAAFKIEGRMRSAEYVAGVVAAYRTALDLIRAGRAEEAVAEGRKRLADVIGREETPGLTGGAAPAAVVAGGSTGSVGELIGPVTEVRDGWAHVPAQASVTRGDRLRAQFSSDGSGKGFSALALRADATGFYVKVPFDVSPGDLLFRVGGGGRAGITRTARREMEALPSEGVRFRVLVGDAVVAVEAAYGKTRREYPFRVSGGRGREVFAIPPDAEAQLRSAYRSDLPLGGVRVDGHGAGVAWRDVAELFLKAARAFDKEFYLAGKELRLSILPTLRVAGSREGEMPTVFFVACRPEQVDRLPRAPEIVPVVEFTKGLARDPSQAGRWVRDRGYLRLPPPLLESDAAFFRRTVREAVGKGFRRWIVSDLGHFGLFSSFVPRKQVTLVGDHYLYAFNTGSLSVLSRLGASRMVLPVEASLASLRATGKYLHELGIAVAYGAIPMMISRLVPASGVKGDVVSPREERFTVEVSERGSTIRPAVPFSASGHLHEIRAAGIRDFYADLCGTPAEDVEPVLSALFADRPIPGTSTFNLFRGNF